MKLSASTLVLALIAALALAVLAPPAREIIAGLALAGILVLGAGNDNQRVLAESEVTRQEAKRFRARISRQI